MAGYDPTIIQAILQRASQVTDPSARGRYTRAALQTGIVESGLRNLDHGDADSLGWRQERASLYPNPTNVQASVDRFFQEAAQHDRGQPSWQLAADVQRPAEQYRGRYKDVAREAARLLGGASPGAAPSPGPARTPSAGGVAGVAAPSAPSILDSGQAGDFTSVLAALGPQASPQQQAASIPPPPTPSLAMPQGFQPIQPGGQEPPRQETGVSGALGLLESLRGSGPTIGASGGAGASDAPQIAQKVFADRKVGVRPSPDDYSTVPMGGSKNAGKGTFNVSGPNPGRLQKGLTSFAEEVAKVYGGTLTGLDGSTHSKYTVNGNVSEHYTGNATDIFTIDGKPATGARLIRAGRAALIAAGMPRGEALKAPGGLYNVNGHQIIFGVNGRQYGGNHLDHLHISTHA